MYLSLFIIYINLNSLTTIGDTSAYKKSLDDACKQIVTKSEAICEYAWTDNQDDGRWARYHCECKVKSKEK